MHDDERVLESIIGELRSEVPPRSRWRRALQDRLDAEARELGRPRDESRSAGRGALFSVHPFVAIAASVALLAVGGLGGAFLSSRADARTDARGGGSVEQSPSMTMVSNGDGTIGSTVGVRFAVVAPGVRRVSLVGDFNGWDPAATPLQRERDQQTWSILLPMAQGRYSYAFVIDGAVVADPTAPSAIDDDFGTPTSLMLVSRETR